MERSIFNDDFPFAQLGLTVLVSLSCLILSFLVGFLAALPIFHMPPYELYRQLENINNIPIQKYFQVVQAVGLFIVPAFILSKVFSGWSFNYLMLNRTSKSVNFMLVIVIMLSALPVINLLAELNSMIRLPESMSGLQQMMERSSKAYETASEAFLKVNSPWGLTLNLFIIALLPALGEELFFRGIVQRIFVNMFNNIHIGIVISAFIFSALHMEFYAFFPRWALGVMFGYMLIWSGSIWLPVLAHFINNALAVVVYYLINHGMVDKSVGTFGSARDIIPLTFICAMIMATGLFYLYKKTRMNPYYDIEKE